MIEYKERKFTIKMLSHMSWDNRTNFDNLIKINLRKELSQNESL